MRGLVFAGPPTPVLPRHRPSTLAIAAGIHVALFALLIVVKTRPVSLSSAGASTGIAAYVTTATGTSAPKAEAPKKTAPAAQPAKAAPKEDQTSAGSGAEQAAMSAQPVAGPVRLGSGGSLTLLKKVSPIYPSVMQSAHISGQVVLDAVIHADGSIGDVKVLRSTNELFARAAIDAVKQWRYTSLPYEGIVTVTVNFTLT
jgi:TonB family protein